MRAIIVGLLLALVSCVALADTYQVTVGWTDPTSYNPADTPSYEAKWRVAAGAETVIPGLTSTAASFEVVANPGDPIEVSVRALNQGLVSAWTGWVAAGAPYPITQPLDQGGVSITVVRTGP